MENFNEILVNLMRPENEFRSKAEKVYETIPAKDKVQFLFMTICEDTQSEEIRHFAAILMRRALFTSYEEITKSVDATFMEQLKTHVLVLIQKDNITLRLRKKICDIASEISKNCIDNDGNNQWPDLLNFMFNGANSPNLELRECSLFLFNSLPTIFGNDQNKYLDYIKKMLLKCLCEESNESVKLAALKATASFILINNEDNAIIRLFTENILPMLKIMNDLIEKEEEEPLLSFIELAEKCPQILRSNFNSLMEICMKTIGNSESPDKLKFSALEIIVSYAENAPPTVRKRGAAYLNPLITQLLLMMTDIEEEPNWSFNEAEDDDQDSDSNNIVGETSLDRLACAIGGKTVFPIAIQIISQMLQNPDWKQRYAALMAISALGEGCHKQMLPMLERIVNVILPFTGDPHPRVRYAVCNALGQMASDFSPNFEELFHDKFIPSLLMLLDDNQNPRVQAHAAAAFVNFFEEANQKIIINYADNIVQKFEEVLKSKMEELMKKGTKLVLEQIVVSIASLADVIQEIFINYYDRFMPCLKFIIENANVKELRLLRGKSIECASLIGLAVGSDKFCNDAGQIMNLLLQTQTGEVVLDDDDPQLSYMITSWVRICKLLGAKFEPYLPMVMPQVMKTASLSVEMAILDQEEIKNYEENSDWQCFSLSDQNFGIKVAGLDDKATACEMLVCYARELKHGFINYVEEATKILVPLLKFYFHEGVRLAAAQSPPFLLDCAKFRGDAYVLEIWNFIIPTLLSSIENESDKSVLSEMLISFAECITTLGMQSLNEANMQELMRVIDVHFNEHFERFNERQAKRTDEDYDDDVEETLNDEDDDDVYILSKIVDILHSLFVSYNDKFLPFFNTIFKHIINLASPERPVSDQQWALCVMDDLIEFCGLKCIEYKDIFIPLFTNNLKSPHAELRQASAYGFGVLAKHGGDSFASILAENIPNMVAIIQDSNSRLAENVNATENAISAITKIIQFNNTMIDVDSLLSCWLSWLPIWEDEEEVIYVYSFLYKLLESNHPIILGVDNFNVPRIVSIILEVFARTVIDHASELGQKLISYVKFVNIDKNISSTFSLEQQNALEQITKC